jgi:hypothetical protein
VQPAPPASISGWYLSPACEIYYRPSGAWRQMSGRAGARVV